MFEAVLSNGVVLKKIVESIKELVTEVNLEITSDGLSIQAMDSSHIALIVLILKASEFEEFQCDRPQNLGISITYLNKLLKIAGNDDSIKLKSESDSGILTLTFQGPNNEKICEFNLNLLTLDAEHLGIPEQEYSAEVKMSSLEFTKICRELTQVTDTLNISIDKEAIKFAVSGNVGAGCITMRGNVSDKVEENLFIRVNGNVNMAFSLRYLNLFNKAAMLSEEVVLFLSPEVPIVIQFVFDLGELKYFLAPKVADDN
ncbi:unnamed protein product [Blepharisma stoltei]|uniref:DNA sliding clamp PCNA n=1 Tax=Blepharisma stoltei TaxID=1481888 RepID=A0AAU9IFQ0_9CILI|nr:unnamed protein product [Blepharisma stoltei]